VLLVQPLVADTAHARDALNHSTEQEPAPGLNCTKMTTSAAPTRMPSSVRRSAPVFPTPGSGEPLLPPLLPCGPRRAMGCPPWEARASSEGADARRESTVADAAHGFVFTGATQARPSKRAVGASLASGAPSLYRSR